jgi:putative transposase
VSTASVTRAYRFRFYPTDGQAVELSRTFGCVRLVYNRALDARTAAWHQEQRRVGYTDTSALLTTWKKTDELGFLNEVSSGVREWVCPGCGDSHDRDVNAARNIPAAGRAVAACGDGVRPIRRWSVRHLSEPPFQGRRNRNCPS